MKRRISYLAYICNWILTVFNTPFRVCFVGSDIKERTAQRGTQNGNFSNIL